MSETSRPLPSAGSFYDEIGGEQTFRTLVAHFYGAVREDPILRPMYPADDWDGAETRLRMRHAPFAVDEKARDAWLTHMRAAVDSLGLTAEQDATLWGYLEMAAHSMQNR